MPLHVLTWTQWLILPRPDRGYQKQRKFTHLRFQRFLLPNLRIIPPCLARLCRIHTRSRGLGAGLWNLRPRVQTMQKSSGRDHLRLQLYLQEKVIIQKQLVRQAMGKERLMVRVCFSPPSIKKLMPNFSSSRRAYSVQRQAQQQIRRLIRAILGQKPNYGMKLKCSVSSTYPGSLKITNSQFTQLSLEPSQHSIPAPFFAY